VFFLLIEVFRSFWTVKPSKNSWEDDLKNATVEIFLDEGSDIVYRDFIFLSNLTTKIPQQHDTGG
jgi:hypothetical protein